MNKEVDNLMKTNEEMEQLLAEYTKIVELCK